MLYGTDCWAIKRSQAKARGGGDSDVKVDVWEHMNGPDKEICFTGEVRGGMYHKEK